MVSGCRRQRHLIPQPGLHFNSLSEGQARGRTGVARMRTGIRAFRAVSVGSTLASAESVSSNASATARPSSNGQFTA
jgi:hypothetical protein